MPTRSMFCLLEKNDTTFNYVKECLAFLEKRDKAVLSFDNGIQYRELFAHFQRKGINEPELQQLEAIDWINKYACDFRSYLNTIKIAASFLHYKEIKSDELSREEFEKCCDAINNLNEFLSEGIF
ncbi:MAG TPA: hypothetical protein PLE45_03900 [Spirochaetota bacterium]|nr:hypothetical protein [Spirochaetota bacterium]HOL56445.1 hypothetical protein [Spirochaetota bacterium]HPP04461.1 hypothetical protein [Spirochaetota bacterium]